ncbi:MAG: twin-arginine translocation signal domain-containing protein, partial [Allorhizobium sp.]
MSDEPENVSSRRTFLRQAAMTGAGLVAGASVARASGPDPKITEVQPWA